MIDRFNCLSIGTVTIRHDFERLRGFEDNISTTVASYTNSGAHDLNFDWVYLIGWSKFVFNSM